jgi:ABC-type Na+ efflux pump permease subunit
VSRPTGQGVLGTLFRHEIRMLLRDTRTILITVVAPLVIFPLYIVMMNVVADREEQALEEEVYSYAIIGSEAEWIEELVASAIQLETIDPDTTRAPVRL